jgi:parvulin-like peptidyl-prolyl isomerase
MTIANRSPRPLAGFPLHLAVAAMLAAACSRGAAEDVVARVGGTDVTREEVRGYLEALGPSEREAVAKDPALRAQVVRAYLARRAVLKEARSKRWDEEPGVKAQLDRARDEALTELYLQSVSRPAAGYPSDAEVQAAYDASKSAFQVPRQYRVAQIFVAAPRSADRDAEAKARRRIDEIAAKLKQKGADFSAIARSDSDEKSAAQRGGEIGWLSEQEMVSGIRATVAGLERGGVSEAIRLDDGWHLVKLLETRPPSTRPLAEVRDAIAARLRAERARTNRQAYLAKLLEQNPPAINELALSSLLAHGAK